MPVPGVVRVPASRAGLRRLYRRQVKDLSESNMEYGTTDELRNTGLGSSPRISLLEYSARVAPVLRIPWDVQFAKAGSPGSHCWGPRSPLGNEPHPSLLRRVR